MFKEKLDIFITIIALIIVGIVNIFHRHIPLETMLLRFITVGIVSYIFGAALKFYVNRYILPEEEEEWEDLEEELDEELDPDEREMFEGFEDIVEGFEDIDDLEENGELIDEYEDNNENHVNENYDNYTEYTEENNDTDIYTDADNSEEY